MRPLLAATAAGIVWCSQAAAVPVVVEKRRLRKWVVAVAEVYIVLCLALEGGCSCRCRSRKASCTCLKQLHMPHRVGRQLL